MACLEQLAVLGGADGLGVGADQLGRAGRGDRAALDELHGEVERRLAAEGGQHRVGLLAVDDAAEHVDVERLDVGGVGELGVGHDRGRVGVGEDDAVALLPEHLAGLRAGVVELARLPDHDRSRADQQDRLEVVAPGHQATPRSASGVAVGRLAAIGDAEHRGEVLEEVGAVVGTGAGLGVVLHAERGRVEHAEALAHAVVEVHVAHLGPAAERVGVDGEVVVLAGDLDPAGGEVAHRVVAAVVAERAASPCRRRAPDRAAGGRGRCRRRARCRAARRWRRWRRARRRGRPGRWRGTPRPAGGRGRRRRWSTRAPPPRRTTRRGGAGSCA